MMFISDCLKPIVEKKHILNIICIAHCVLMQYVKLMCEACHILTILTIFGHSNMLHWKLSLKNQHE